MVCGLILLAKHLEGLCRSPKEKEKKRLHESGEFSGDGYTLASVDEGLVVKVLCEGDETI